MSSDVFISYAREDHAFVERLRQALLDRGRTVWVDLQDILPTEEWWNKVCAGIESANHFVFVLSPFSVSSDVCRRELAHAVQNQKRLVPMLYRDVDAVPIPGELAARQWLPFRASSAFESGLDLLIRALDTDPEWVNGHTRWQVRATQWHRAGRDRSLLLRGRELGESERWLMRATSALDPQPTPLQTQFILASRRGATRRQRLAVATISMGLVVALGLALFAWAQRDEARHQARIAVGRQLAAQAGLMTRPADLERRIVLGIEAMKRVPTPDAHRVLREAVVLLPARPTIMEHAGAVNDVAFAPDGLRLATAGDDRMVHVWDMTGRELARLAHQDLVNAVVFSPDGRWIASASRDRTARVWDASSGRELVRVAHQGWVDAIAFSPDGRLLATGSMDRTAGIWEAATGRSVASLPHGDVVNRVVFSPDGRALATASGSPAAHVLLAAGRDGVQKDDSARVWDLATGRELLRLGHGHNVTDVAFSTDGQFLASASRDGSARLWELPGGRLRHRFSLEASAEAVAFSPDGRYVAAGSGAFFFSATTRTARVWDTDSGREIARLLHTDDVQALAFTPDGDHLATASSDGAARLWAIATREEVLRMSPGSENTAKRVAIAPDGRTLATAHTSGIAALWRIPDRSWRVRMDHTALVRDVAFDAEGRTVISVGDDSIASVADLSDGRRRRLELGAGATPGASVVGNGQYVATVAGNVVRVLAPASGEEIMAVQPDAPVQRLALSPHGRVLAAALDDRSVAVWRVPAGTLVARLRHEQAPVKLWLDDAGHRLAAATAHGMLHIWDLERGTEVARAPHGAEVQDAQFSRDGRRLVSRAEAGVARVWDVDTGRELAHHTHPRSVKAVALSPDGTRVASAADEVVLVWEASTGREVTRFTHPGGVASLAFAPGGRYLASGGFYDRTARVWDIASSREVLDLRYPVPVDRVLFSPDGSRLAVVTGVPLSREHHGVHVWTWRPADLLAEACARLSRNLRVDEWEERIGGRYEATCPAAPDHVLQMLRQGDAFAAAGDRRRAATAFREAVRAAVAGTDAALGNAVCWYGSLDGFARLVLPACDHAVRIASESDRALYIDSRGVARALAGDGRGAIHDLSAALAWFRTTEASADMVPRRESWLAALRAGRNPFDPGTLAALKSE